MLRTVILGLLLFAPVLYVNAEYSQNFDNLSNGDIDGQENWRSDPTGITDINGTQYVSSPKSLLVSDSG